MCGLSEGDVPNVGILMRRGRVMQKMMKRRCLVVETRERVKISLDLASKWRRLSIGMKLKETKVAEKRRWHAAARAFNAAQNKEGKFQGLRLECAAGPSPTHSPVYRSSICPAMIMHRLLRLRQMKEVIH